MPSAPEGDVAAADAITRAVTHDLDERSHCLPGCLACEAIASEQVLRTALAAATSRAEEAEALWPKEHAGCLAQIEQANRETAISDARAEAAERTAATLREDRDVLTATFQREQQVLWREWEERRNTMLRLHEAEATALRAEVAALTTERDEAITSLEHIESPSHRWAFRHLQNQLIAARRQVGMPETEGA